LDFGCDPKGGRDANQRPHCSINRKIRSAVFEKNAGVVEGIQKHSHQVSKHSYQASKMNRQAECKGHHILLRTTDGLEVGGKPIVAHLQLDDAGRVHYHPVRSKPELCLGVGHGKTINRRTSPMTSVALQKIPFIGIL
jgi:hypothetical protein